jgi:protein-tyrosine phosphatase
MEILPHFWITHYGTNIHFIKKKKIKNIIHLSKKEPFTKKDDSEEIRIVIDYNDNDSYEHMNNLMFQQLSDITEYIHDKIINNEKVLLIGYYNKQDIDTIIVAYLLRYARITIHDAILFLKTKKADIFSPKCLFYFALNKFYNNLNK